MILFLIIFLATSVWATIVPGTDITALAINAEGRGFYSFFDPRFKVDRATRGCVACFELITNNQI
jgi:UDP-N-acetylmuramyl pentapeptide phosphotransferase/UDP-N-acetylglucosamine-1-phosphate transferase